MKRFLSLLLTLCLLLTLLPSVLAADTLPLNDYEWETLLLTNRERLAEGLEPVTATDFLQNACDIRAEEIATLFDHVRPDGTMCYSVLGEVSAPSYRTVGENIAAGYGTPQSVVTGWMNSPGHRANILDAGFVHMGVGYAKLSGSYTHYWVQFFFTGWGCSYSEMKLLLPDNMQFALGTGIDEMHLTAKLECENCGTAYLPIMAEFCTGFDAQKAGTQNVMVHCFGLQAEFTVTLGSSSEPGCAYGTDCPGQRFADMPAAGNWAHAGIDFVVARGLFDGITETTFAPGSDMTRAMLVTVLWRYEGKPLEGTNTFMDVPDGKYYTDAVTWAAANGIVGGIGGGKFAPEGNITREQMAAILFRYAAYKGIDTGKRGELTAFPDAEKISRYAKDAVQWTVAEGIIGGSEGMLLPQGNATRAQVATILARFIQNVVEA